MRIWSYDGISRRAAPLAGDLTHAPSSEEGQDQHHDGRGLARSAQARGDRRADGRVDPARAPGRALPDTQGGQVMAALKVDKGKLLLDFTYRGVRCREYLSLDDSKEGRARAKQTQRIIEGEVASGSLDYAARFPRSKRVRPGGPFAPPPH